MLKILSVAFVGHPVLGNLELDFCDESGNPADTILIAGENGTGKSSILEALYGIASRSRRFFSNMVVVYQLDDGSTLKVDYDNCFHGRISDSIVAHFNNDVEYLSSEEYFRRIPASGIYSDVDINFNSHAISNVSSLCLDAETSSRRSTGSLSSDVYQLLIDVQAQDDAALALVAKQNPYVSFSELSIERKMDRFVTAFSYVFDDLVYDRIDTSDHRKRVVFQKLGQDVFLDDLSSGEKQIVFRGCFLLKDANALKGAFVFIDEPEISLHPSWQEKILRFYQSLFTDSEGVQTSQLFVVTHSPFILHNEARRNDKVIVLKRDGFGRIVACDKPEYYGWNSPVAIRDAFQISGFSVQGNPTVYVEGRTDEKYLKRAQGVFGGNYSFSIKWVGRIDSAGQERNTGSSAPAKAFDFLVAQNLSYPNACLFDCDTKRGREREGSVLSTTLPRFENSNGIFRGIENALILEKEYLEPFYIEKEEITDYGGKNRIQSLDKMRLCEDVCGMDENELKLVFSNLRSVLDDLQSFFDGYDRESANTLKQ